jgi:hypothetical protein
VAQTLTHVPKAQHRPPAARIRLNPKQRAEFEEREASLLMHVGAYGSGKTTLDAAIILDRSNWDTGQRFGFFANTEEQALEGIWPDIQEWLDKANIEWRFGSKAPAQWIRRWERQGIPYPTSGPRSPNTYILENGLHIVIGGLGNGKFRRFKGYRFGAALIEEGTEQPNEEPLQFIFARVRCGDWGTGLCQRYHRHQLYWRGNPPDPRKPHWIRNYVKRKLEEEERRQAAGMRRFFRFIQSSTHDNVENVGPEYIERLRSGLDPVLARAYIDGSIEQVSTGRTYYAWSSENIIPVGYDAQRAIHVSLDFNVDPACATLGHELRDPEVPELYRGKGLTHLGTFGELYFEGGMDAVSLARTLLSGERVFGAHWPDEFQGLARHGGTVLMYGDATARMRRVESPNLRSAWAQVNEVMSSLGRRYQFDVPEENPSVYDSVTALNSKMRAENGERSYWTDRRCTELVADYESVVPKADGSDWIDKKRDPKRSHLSDCDRYRIWRRCPMNRPGALKGAWGEERAAGSLDQFGQLGAGAWS